MNPRNCRRCGLVGLAVLTLALSGCGRRGPLEPPPDVPASDVAPTQVHTINPMAGDLAQPGQRPVRASGASTATNGKTFLLDPLVK